MTYRVQIITAKGEPVIDARVPWFGYMPQLVAIGGSGGVGRYQDADATDWKYFGYTPYNLYQIQSTKELTEAFRVAGMFDQREK